MIKDEQVTKAAERVASQLKLSGFFGMDFIIDSRTDTPYLIEMNPRCTQLGHIEFIDQGSLAGALSAVLRGGSSATVHSEIDANPQDCLVPTGTRGR